MSVAFGLCVALRRLVSSALALFHLWFSRRFLFDRLVVVAWSWLPLYLSCLTLPRLVFCCLVLF